MYNIHCISYTSYTTVECNHGFDLAVIVPAYDWLIYDTDDLYVHEPNYNTRTHTRTHTHALYTRCPHTYSYIVIHSIMSAAQCQWCTLYLLCVPHNSYISLYLLYVLYISSMYPYLLYANVPYRACSHGAYLRDIVSHFIAHYVVLELTMLRRS